MTTTVKLTLHNNFHGTSVTLVIPRPAKNILHMSKGQEARARHHLCGMKDCTCSGAAGVRYESPALLDGMPITIANGYQNEIGLTRLMFRRK